MFKTVKPKIKNLSAEIISFLRKYPLAAYLFKFGLIFTLFWIVAYYSLDPDFGWHLQSGNYILKNWIPSHDIFTYTARNFRWINIEWLNDVFVSIFYKLGGYLLLSIIFACIWTASLAIACFRTRMWILLLASLSLLPFVGIRPIAWTMLALAILIKLINQKTKLSYLLIFLLFLIWANLHGGFVIGFLVILIAAIQQKNPKLLILLLACFAVSLVNPYGAAMYIEVRRTLTDSSLHSQITEWQSFALKPITWNYIVLYFAGFWLFSRSKIKNWLTLGPILFAASLVACRNYPLFVIATLGGLNKYFSKIKNLLPKKMLQSQKIIIWIFCIAIVGWSIYWADTFFIGLAQSPNNLIVISDYLNDHKCAGNLFNDYDLGGYLIWKVPSQPVFIDGRMPSWRDPSGQKYLDTYFSVINGKVWQSVFTKYNITCAVINKKSALESKLVQHNWQIATENGTYVVLSKP